MIYKINDIVKIVKEGEYKGQEGIIVGIDEEATIDLDGLLLIQVTLYLVRLNNGKTNYYFFSEINK